MLGNAAQQLKLRPPSSQERRPAACDRRPAREPAGLCQRCDDAVDRTLGTVVLGQTATTTTSATFTFLATTGATDVIAYKCIAY